MVWLSSTYIHNNSKFSQTVLPTSSHLIQICVDGQELVARFHREIKISRDCIYSILPFLPFSLRNIYRDPIPLSSPIVSLPLLNQIPWDLYPARIEGHTTPVNSVAFSPNGNYIVSGADDHTICIMERTGAAAVRSLEGHTNRVDAVAVFPDGKHVLSGSYDQSVQIWDIESGHSVRILNDCTREVLCVAISKTGERIAAGSTDRAVHIWDISKDYSHQILAGHSDDVYSVAFSPDGDQIISGSQDRSIRVWSSSSGEDVFTLDGHSGSVRSVTYTHDGKHIISGSNDKTIRVWDAKTGDSVRILQGHGGNVRSVTTSPNDKFIISGSWDSSVRVWDLNTSSLLQVLQTPFPVTSVTASRDGTQIVAGTYYGELQLWNFPSHQLRPLTSVEFASDDHHLIATFRDGTSRDLEVTRVGVPDGGATQTPQTYTYSIKPHLYHDIGDGNLGELWEELEGKKRLMCKVPLPLFWEGSRLINRGRHVVIWHTDGLLLHLDFTLAP